MMVTRKYFLSALLRILIDLLLLFNILALIALPWLLTAVYHNPDLLSQLDRRTGPAGPDITIRDEYLVDLPATSYPFYLVFLYVAGAATAGILVEGHLILGRIEKGQLFSAAQTRSFRIMAGAFGFLAVDFAVKIFIYNTLLTMFCCVLFILLVLVALILAEIFRQAYLVQTDNELTI
jgi:hypothetical protein